MAALKGRGARSNRAGRFERLEVRAEDDGWGVLEALLAENRSTEVLTERARSIVSHNDSPDVCVEHTVNPYRGCEHGCIYCYARPGHANLGYSPGLDFESRLIVKENAPALFERHLRNPRWKGAPIAVGTFTDCYQPIEKRYRITRRLLEIALRHGQPLILITKSRLILRDVDILKQMAARRLVRVAVSVTTLERDLARRMEPRAAAPEMRLDVIGRLADESIPVSVLVSPIVPALNDHEIEAILTRAKAAGAASAGMVMLRLPAEIAALFREWLEHHFPERASRVLALVREMHGGKLYDARFGRRMCGAGPYAWTIWRRFELACRRLGMNDRTLALDSSMFTPTPESATGAQLELPGLNE